MSVFLLKRLPSCLGGSAVFVYGPGLKLWTHTYPLVCRACQKRGYSETTAEAVPEEDAEEKELSWTFKSRRTGLIGIKLGMTQMWNKSGKIVPVTLIQILGNQVVQIRTEEKDGYIGMEIGAIDYNKPKNVHRAQLGHFQKAGVPLKKVLKQFKVTEDGLLPVGFEFDVSHFVPGQYVDVSGISIGKGFQGVMKRHHMKGGPASHGSKHHRRRGATGGGSTDPGRVLPGTRMPGRMGNKPCIVKALMIQRINYEHQILYVTGNVPGHKKGILKVRDSVYNWTGVVPPFPTNFQKEGLPVEAYSGKIHQPDAPSIKFPDMRKLAKK